MKNIRVPYGQSVHGNEEIEAVISVLNDSTQMGKKTLELEKKFQKFLIKNSV